MRNICTSIVATLMLAGMTTASTWTVDDDGPADFDNIQAAIDAASDGDEILVYAGTYTGTGDQVVNMLGKAVWLHSSDGPETTIIDGEDVRRGIVCVTAETSETAIEGFTVTRGSTVNLLMGAFNNGGGMLCDFSSPTLTNCVFTENNTIASSQNGGGLANHNSSPMLTDCVFDGNSSFWAGGGIYNRDNSSPALTNCTIRNNSCATTSSWGGGGMFNTGNCSPTLTNCTIENNTASQPGGGIMNQDIGDPSIPMLTDTTVCGNIPDQINGAWTDGGGNTVANTCSGDPTGACCVGTSCSIETAADCTASGGTYLGDGSSCSGDPCGGDPTGACCVDTSCSIGTDADCTASGGTYLGDGSSCSGDPCGAGSTVWTVDDSGGADFYDIQSAVNAALNGDEILVYPGTYTSTGDNVIDMMGKAVWLHSSDGPETTIIDGEDVRRGIVCVTAETSETMIEGFTITRGYTEGAYPDNCSGGMYNYQSSPTLENCIFTNNFAPFGGGMLNDNNSSPMLTNCTFSANAVTSDAGGMYNNVDSNPILENCTFTGNTASGSGGGMVNWSSAPTLTNCTFTGNIASGSGGGMHNYNSDPTLTDTIVCGNTPDQIYGAWTDGGGNFVSDTCSGDPTGACCIDTSCSIGTDADCSAAGGTYLGDGSSCSGDPCGAPTGACCVDTSCSIGTDADCSAAGGTYLGDGSSCSGDPCGAGSTVWTVDDSGGADFYDIQSAVNAALNGDEILVYPGTYTDTGAAVVDMMGKAVWLHSSDGSETTIIDGEGVRRGMLCGSGETSKTIIEGFTISNGYADIGGGMYNEASSPTLTECTFTGNYGDDGGGMLNADSSPTLMNCTFEGNTATWGGGMENHSSNPTLMNCTFEGNTATYGGGMGNYYSSSPTLDGCTFTNNSATVGGGMGNYDSSSPTLTSTTVCGNSPDQINGEWTDNGGNYVADTCGGDPYGACCIDTSCSIGTDADCSAAGGTYLGDGSSCSGDPCGAGSTVWTVDDSGGADFYDIQSAVNAALNGDEILVYPGTYTSTGDNVIDMMGKAVWLHSSDGPETTIIDGEGARRVLQCVNGESLDMVIDGFTITGGYADWGGGIFCSNSNPTLTNCEISGNTATDGGGIVCTYDSNPTLTDCTISGNTGSNWAGGIGCFYESSPTLTNCVISDNMMITGSAQGGGISCYDSSNPTLTECTISGNTVIADGGGIHCYSSNPTISGCTISGNTATYGGGIYCYEGNPTLTDTLLCENSPDAIYGPWTDGGWNLFWNDCNDCNSNGIDDAQDILEGTVTDVDNDGMPDECETDCDGDGTPDPIEIYLGEADDVDDDGHPDNCEPDCNENAIPDDYEIEQGWAEDCNDNLVPDDCDLEDPLLDCNGDGLLDACQELDDEMDCDGNGLMDACEILADPSLDCNASGTLDSCDVDSGSSDDINGDGIPDECQCLADIDESGSVDVNDVLLVISQWGLIDGSADVNEDGIVNVSDLLAILSAWGPCP